MGVLLLRGYTQKQGLATKAICGVTGNQGRMPMRSLRHVVTTFVFLLWTAQASVRTVIIGKAA
jgi:hypothetical protein